MSTPTQSKRPNWFKYILLDWDRTQMALSLALIGLLALAPLFVKSPYYMGIIILTTMYMFIGISWNIVAGFAGSEWARPSSYSSASERFRRQPPDRLLFSTHFNYTITRPSA